MGGVKIIEGAPLNTPLAELSEKERDLYARMRASAAICALQKDCRQIVELMAEAEQVGWLGEADRDGFIVNVLKRPVRMIDLALEGLQWFDPERRPVPHDDAVQKQRPAVTIRSDIAEYSRQAAAVLESSARWLGDHIQLHQKIDPEGEADLVLQPDDLKTTAENLTNGAALLRWLADFEDKGGAA